MILASEVCWDIIEALRKRGSLGMTAKEIQEKLKPKRYPPSTIYTALTQLERAAWIQSGRPIPKWGRKGPEEKKLEKRTGRGGRPRKVYKIHPVWGLPVDDDFAESLKPIVKKHSTPLKEVWFKVLDNIVEEYKTTEKLSKFYPCDDMCTDCNLRHDAYEFLTAISYAITDFLEEEKEWEDLMKKHEFMKK
jgi:hypothetical protein